LQQWRLLGAERSPIKAFAAGLLTGREDVWMEAMLASAEKGAE